MAKEEGWVANPGQQKWLDTLKMSQDIMALEAKAKHYAELQDAKAGQKLIIRQAEAAMADQEDIFRVSGELKGSNQAARDAELRVAMKGNEAWGNAHEAKLEAENTLDGINADIEAEEKKFTAARVILEAKMAILNFFAGTTIIK